jgi:hypothetical protein
MTAGITIKLASGAELTVPGATQLLLAGEFICVEGAEGSHLAMIRASEVVYAKPTEAELDRSSHQRGAVEPP